jgi:multidrug efflux pump subunit AcrA (membrane-fusion protein)
MIDRRVNLGDRVRPGQLVARLEPQNEQNALRSARASLVAAQGQLVNARASLQRREPLAARGAVSLAELDQARESFQTAKAQVDAAEAQVKFAQDQLGFTELRADTAGVITAVARSRARWWVRDAWSSRWRGRADATRSSTCRASSCARRRATRRSPCP